MVSTETNTAHEQAEPHRPPRVCILAETYHPVRGGSENHARLLTNQMNRMGLDTFVITRQVDPTSPRCEMLDGTNVYRVPPSGLGRWGKFLTPPFMARELENRSEEYDLVYVCGFRTIGVSALQTCRRLGKLCILRAETTGEMTGEYATAYRKLSPPERIVFRWWLANRNRRLRTADSFVSISNLLRQEFIDCGVDESRTYHIPNGIDSGIYHPVDPQTKQSLRRKLGLPESDHVVVFSARLIYGKGAVTLISAWDHVAQTTDRTHLVIVGTGEHEKLSCEHDLRRFVHERRLQARVTFAGWSTAVHEYLQASDLFVFPSEWEGFGISLVEAMACQLPVITCGVGGIAEIVTNMHDGILVPPRDPQQLAVAIRRVMDDPVLAAGLAANALQTFRERYTIEAVARRHYELFTSLYQQRMERLLGVRS